MTRPAATLLFFHPTGISQSGDSACFTDTVSVLQRTAQGCREHRVKPRTRGTWAWGQQPGREAQLAANLCVEQQRGCGVRAGESQCGCAATQHHLYRVWQEEGRDLLSLEHFLQVLSRCQSPPSPSLLLLGPSTCWQLHPAPHERPAVSGHAGL